MEDTMGTRRLSRSTTTGLAVFALAMMPAAARPAVTTTVIHSFEEDEGEYPSTDLVLDAEGNLYGTTVEGGDFGGGTIFQLSRAGDTWTHTVLYNFTGQADGGQPYGGVTLDAQGNLYGTAVIGGSGGICAEDGCGVAYKLAKSGESWSFSVIHDFTGGDDGSGPGAGLTIDANGNLYGMTPTGGTYGLGVIFELSPLQNGAYALTVIHTFTGGSDGGAASAGRLLLDDAGNLYGVATVGGAYGQGVVFTLASAGGSWDFTTLYAFKGQPDAGSPYGGLIFDNAGNLYGTTYYEGANDLGTVYRLVYRNGSWHETVLYSFKGGTDGASPISNLVIDAAGNLYGTTSEGGAPGCGCGTIFRLARVSGDTWRERILYRFRGAPDGAFPYNGMVTDRAGHLYGATVHGGDDDDGAIYQVGAGSMAADLATDGAIAVETDVANAPVLEAARALLLRGIPNPFRGGGTTLHYALPHAGRVRLSVYGVDGRLVRVLCDRVEAAGVHDVGWDGTTDGGAVVSRGTYVCEMEFAGARQQVRLTSSR
jgi:uncharacterized repeat protein (TIGR03803 family)